MLTDVAAMIALIIARLLVAATITVATNAKTVVIEPRLYIMNSCLGHLFRGYQRYNL